MEQKRTFTAAWGRVLKFWRKEAKKNDGILKCAACGQNIYVDVFPFPHPQSLSIDHIVAFSLGGEDTIANSQPMHLIENQRKSNKYAGNTLRRSKNWF